ncbi:HET-domain-containing protein [Zalerion maritima]|uniref:HET-domain-containing protein n=1 Tax=Zalerion maritima TaxID=339359 RepID=A0AAD5RLX7_9PEZI|nr:HET-domain-containing protein [Zalerion maritima]
MTQPNFTYRPLPTQDSIRLLHLHPASAPSSPIHVHFSVARLRAAPRLILRSTPKYEALSYTWGDASERLTIFGDDDGALLLVTRNLFEALSHLRHASAPRTLWVDAVCINQDDVPERDAQVRLMARIYGAAERVVVWLGPAVDGSDLVPALVSRLASLWDERDEDDTRLVTRDETERHGIPARHDPAWAAFLALLRRPWTARVWVIQEVALSRRAVVVCGRAEMGWDELAVSASVLSRYHIFDAARLAGTDGIPTIDAARVQVRDGEHFDLEFQLAHARTFRATDPRDRVFALLGIVTDEDRAAVRPDYAADAAALYVAVAWYFVRSTGCLGILEHAGCFGRNIDLLPSWAPDWSITLPENYMSLVDVCHGAYWLDVEKHALVATDVGDDKRLCVDGVRIDLVDAVGCVLDEGGGEDAVSTVVAGKAEGDQYSSREKRFAHVFEEWETLALTIDGSLYPRDVYGDTVINAYWKTLVAGTTADSEEVDVDYARYFLDWYGKHRENGRMDTAGVVSQRDPEDSTSEEGATIYGGCVFDVCFGRRFGKTKSRYMGVFPRQTQRGDIIALLFGCRFPVVLREVKDGWDFLGVCYVHGIWPDEFVGNAAANGDKAERFTLL